MLKLKYPFLFLFIALFPCFQNQLKAQNLIADWSMEEFSTCPTQLLFDQFLPTWISMRGNPDYFNACSPNLGPLTNPFGYQEPRTGDAIVGVITYHGGLPNGREYPGVELIDPLVIGHEYQISYHVSLAHSLGNNYSTRATNNLGILLLTEPWLSIDELGPIPNFAHVNEDVILSDTTEWLHISGIITADSAYRYVAFGNFYDDNQTLWEFYDPNNMDGNLAYYFFDHFCIVELGGDCTQVLSSRDQNHVDLRVLLYPNPARDVLKFQSERKLIGCSIYSSSGLLVSKISFKGNETVPQLELPKLTSGVYMVITETDGGYFKQRLVINP